MFAYNWDLARCPLFRVVQRREIVREVCRVLLDKVAIPDGQNFSQNLQALAVIKL